MKAVTKSGLAFAILAALTGACGDTGGSNDGETTGGVNVDSGMNKPDSAATAGGNDGMIPGMLPAASECGTRADGTQLDSSAAGGCYYFYCYQTETELRAAATEGGACANDTDVAIQCDGESVRTVATCARENGIKLAAGDGEELVAACVRKNKKLAKFSDACLDCNVASASCAAKNCLAVCVSGDSVACDECREKNACTPDFYTCAGLPNPEK